MWLHEFFVLFFDLTNLMFFCLFSRSSKKARRSSSFCQTQARRNSVKRELRSSFIRKIIANNSREHISSTGPESNDLLNGQVV